MQKKILLNGQPLNRTMLKKATCSRKFKISLTEKTAWIEFFFKEINSLLLPSSFRNYSRLWWQWIVGELSVCQLMKAQTNTILNLFTKYMETVKNILKNILKFCSSYCTRQYRVVSDWQTKRESYAKADLQNT